MEEEKELRSVITNNVLLLREEDKENGIINDDGIDDGRVRLTLDNYLIIAREKVNKENLESIMLSSISESTKPALQNL